MNTNDEKIQWHPAFDAALQIEFGDEAKYLEFDPEHLISKKPMQIDVLVKNEKHVKLRKNIGRIFRQYNIIEYKSPEDDLDIDDFYKTYATAAPRWLPWSALLCPTRITTNGALPTPAALCWTPRTGRQSGYCI